MDEFKKIVNGFGERLNRVEHIQGRHDERIKDNKENTVDLYKIINEIREEIKKINESINSGILKVILIVAVPTILVLYQLISK